MGEVNDRDGVLNECVHYDLNYFEEHGIRKGTPLTGLGSGDSCLYLDVVSNDLSDKLFERLDSEIDWNTMTHKGGPVPRLISIQGERCHTACFPLYRHPADEQPTTIEFTPTALQCKNEISEVLGQSFNHALIQKYRSGNDNISEHADKSLDIAKGTMIVNLSVGSTRVMILKSKSDHPSNQVITGPDGETRVLKIVQKITLPPNSLFVLGWDTNLMFTHAIKADKRKEWEKRPDERLYDGQRISLTFRNISTFISPVGKIFGQGARMKEPLSDSDLCPSPDLYDHSSAAVAIGTMAADSQKEEECKQLLSTFGVENKSSAFDWDKYYGTGFDVVNFTILNNGVKH